VVLFFNGAAGAKLEGLFKNNTGDISAANEVYITPSGWTFATWGIIYTWQALWIVFNVILIFVRHNNERLYYEPPVLTLWFHACITVNFLSNITWLFLWDNQLFNWCFAVILIQLGTAYAAVAIATKNAYDAEPFLRNNPGTIGKQWVTWCYRILVNNGLTYYATWLTCATLISLASSITYLWAPSEYIESYKETSGIISLSILTVILLAYFISDVYFFEKYLRWTFSIYIQLLWALSGIISKNWNLGTNACGIFTLVLIIVVAILFIVKIIVTVLKTILDL